jgi:hypothetical protein
MTDRAQRYLRKKAHNRGFRPDIDPRVLEHYVVDGARLGRPKEISEEIEAALLANVRSSRSGREKSSEVLAYEAGVVGAHPPTLRVRQPVGHVR